MKWEYKVVNLGTMLQLGKVIRNKVQKICDELGEEGWELVSFQSYDLATKILLIFKREKIEK